MRFTSVEQMPSFGIEIDSGTLACALCHKEYPICSGVPRINPPVTEDSRVKKTTDSFSWEWKRYPGVLAEDERVFLEEAQIAARELQGKFVLDAGCGMGRYALAAIALGAEVVALDQSDSLERLIEESHTNPKLHVVQGDLLRPPFKKEQFDFVYSHGVLHHTADTKAAFFSVAGLVKPGGLLSVWVYGQAGCYADFASNPLKSDRVWVARHRRLAWAIVGVRHFLSDLLRLFTTRLPVPLTYAISFPLAILGMVPGLKYLTYSVHPNFKVRLIENFDWLAPPFQHHHSKEELAGWFKEAGFAVLKVLPHGLVPKPGILGRKNGF